jgi:hypothetical protein
LFLFYDLIGREKATSLNDMRDMLANLPEFQETRDRFSLHLNLAEKCMDIFAQKKLLEVGLVEQVTLPLRSEINPELCDRRNSRRQTTKDTTGGHGSSSSRTSSCVLPAVT